MSIRVLHMLNNGMRERGFVGLSRFFLRFRRSRIRRRSFLHGRLRAEKNILSLFEKYFISRIAVSWAKHISLS